MSLKRILSMVMIVVMCFALCACGSPPESSSKKSEKKSDSSKNEKNDDKDSDDVSDGLTGLFDKLKEDKDENAGSGKGGGKKESSNTDLVAGYDNYSAGAGVNNNDPLPGSHSDNGEEEQGPRTDTGIDTSGLSAKHGKAYEYLYTQSGYNSDGTWDYTDQDGYIHDGDMVMERILTVYRFSDRSEIEYMLESAGEWGEYWHVSYNFPADCVYFDYIEGGTVTISGNQAVWEDESGQYREIYTLKSTREFDN